MRILLLTNKCPPDFDGGYELRAFQVAEGLRARGHDLDIVTSRYRETFRGERVDPPWVHRLFRYVGISSRRGVLRQVDRVFRHIEATRVAGENVPALECFLADRQYDVCYAFGLLRVSFAVLGPVASRGIPVLHHAGSTCIADHFFHWPRTIPGYRFAMQTLTRGWYERERKVDFANVAYVSDFLRDRSAARGFRPPGSYVVSRGIDFPIADDLDRERASPPVFLLACRVDRTKGIHVAIRAGGALLRRSPSLRWRIEVAGASLDPGYLSEIHALILQEGIQDRVQFLGRLSHDAVLSHMRKACAFVFAATYGEPFSSTIIEALASGTPLIGADDGAIFEMVQPDLSGLVYPKHDFEALSRHMETVLSQPQRARDLAIAGLEVVRQRFTLDRILDRTEEILESVRTGAERVTHPITGIFILSNMREYGGAEKSIATLLPHLSAAAHVCIFTENDQHTRESEKLATVTGNESAGRQGLTVVRCARGNGVVALLHTLGKLLRALLRDRPQVLLANGHKGGLFLVLLRLLTPWAQTKYAIYVRDFDYYWLDRYLRWLPGCLLLAPSRAVFEHPRYQAMRLDRFPCKVIENAARLPQEHLDEEDGYVGCCARLLPWKGIEYLLQAFARVLPHRPGATLRIIGEPVDAEYAAGLHVLSRQLGIQESVRFLPPVADLTRFYQRGSVFVVSSVNEIPGPESFGRVIIEAWSHGKPVIAFDCGGPREIIEDGRDGYLVPEKDVAQLAERLEELLADPARRREMGSRGLEKVRTRYDPERIGRELLTVLAAHANT